ncbi:extracellular solute-binding protein [Streptomyces erythrochromogenes]|uniref:ABC transporter substrate-binding protein n=1 Tax=Streptomyces erythrochromogenes TaxID=285574 RepID=UPI00344091B1
MHFSRTGIALAAVGAVAATCLSVFHIPPPGSASGGTDAVSAEAAGGMSRLVAQARKEGTLNAIALPRDWAGYGGLMDGFEKKYGIQVNVENPRGASQDEINAMATRRGQERAPDVVDLGGSFNLVAASQGLLAPYRVASFDDIPPAQKDAGARWYNDYGGYISIGCDASRVARCPTTFADLLKPEYKGQVALTGAPTASGSAFASVYAAALARGGSFENIEPGVAFFSQLKKNGNFSPVTATPATIAQGETPITVDWDYLNAGYTKQFTAQGMKWKVSVPADGIYSEYYSQAINKYAPHPAAARLWEEYLYSAEGQNGFLAGLARPVLMKKMSDEGTLDREAAAKLPHVSAAPRFPTEGELDRAKTVVSQQWATAVTE